MSEKLKYVGWGLTGTPKGRRQQGFGADLALKLADSYDLEQQMGGCLPDPRSTETEPLYCLSYIPYQTTGVLGLAEYSSIYEQGQTRAGSYYGAFVEVAGHSFDVQQLETLFTALYELSAYQFKHFIDADKRMYHSTFVGQPIQEPKQELTKIAEGMKPLARNLFAKDATENLYIHCGGGQILETLRAILQTKLYYRYRKIYFSDNGHISKQMQGKNMQQISATHLAFAPTLLAPYEQLSAEFEKQLVQRDQSINSLNTELQSLKSHQQTMVNNAVTQQVAEYKQKMDQDLAYERQRAGEAERKAESNQKLAMLGKQVFEVAVENAGLFGQYQMAEQYAKPKDNTEFVALQNQLAALSQKLDRQAMEAREAREMQQVEPESSTNILTWIFAGLSILLLILSVFLFFTDKSSEYEASQKKVTNLEAKLKELEQNQGNASELSRQLKSITTEKDRLQGNIERECSTDSIKKSKDNKALCDKLR